MPKIAYINKNPADVTLEMIKNANTIIAEYAAQGFQLTIRQLHYQFVSRDLYANTYQNYKRLIAAMTTGRMAGLVDWNAIVDNTRDTVSNSHWETPRDIMKDVPYWYAIDKWVGQEYRPEVWIEKDALSGVIRPVCRELDVPFLACRGYTSISEMWDSSMRMRRWKQNHKQQPFIIHLGDHDPSGVDMSRDIIDRLKTFGVTLQFTRLALNMDQIQQYNPPPNFAKQSDSRATGYMAKFGDESWELDALNPTVLADLVRNAILGLRDQDAWEARLKLQEERRAILTKAFERWEYDIQPMVVDWVEEDKAAEEEQEGEE